jgi:hypothetical protein
MFGKTQYGEALRGDFGHNIVGFRTRGNAAIPAGALGALGDDTSTLLDLGFSFQQAAEIISDYNNGVISASDYNEIVSGNVPPANLEDFINASYGAQTGKSSAATIAVSTLPGNVLLPGPSPRVGVPTTSPFSWLSQSSLIAGFPNWLLLAPLLLLVIPTGGRRR